MIVDMSTPMTCFAPALTANLADEIQSTFTGEEASIGHEHAENPCTTSYVQDDFVFKEVFVLVDGILV